jgi:hypothetical protein
MGAERSVELMPEMQLEARVAVDQVEALFSTVTLSVCGAAIAAGVLVAVLHWLGAVDPWVGSL